MRYNSYILLLILLFIGTFRYILTPQTQITSESKVHCSGQINKFPAVKENYQKISINCKELKISSKNDTIYQKDITISANTKLYPSLQYGDHLLIEGTVNKNKVVSYPKIKINEMKDSGIQASLYKFRMSLETIIYKHLPSQNATLVIGMILGSSRSFSSGVTEDLRKTGTLHMVVVSGYNVAILTGLFLRLSGVVHRRIAIVCSIISIILFVIITGAEPPTIRAGTMGGIILLGQIFGRKGSAMYLLLLTASIYFAVSPMIITELSFQLSCVATAGILVLPEIIKPHTTHYLEQIQNKNLKKTASFITTEVATTLAAQLAVAPIIMMQFEQVSLIAPLANLATSWTIPIIMLSGVGIILAHVINPLVATYVSFIPEIITAYFLQCTRLFSQLPFSSIDGFKINWSLMLTYYIGISLLIIKSRRDKKYSKEENL